MHNSIDSEHRYYSLAYTHLTQSIISMINELCRIFDKGGAKKNRRGLHEWESFHRKIEIELCIISNFVQNGDCMNTFKFICYCPKYSLLAAGEVVVIKVCLHVYGL